MLMALGSRFGVRNWGTVTLEPVNLVASLALLVRCLVANRAQAASKKKKTVAAFADDFIGRRNEGNGAGLDA